MPYLWYTSQKSRAYHLTILSIYWGNITEYWINYIPTMALFPTAAHSHHEFQILLPNNNSLRVHYWSSIFTNIRGKKRRHFTPLPPPVVLYDFLPRRMNVSSDIPRLIDRSCHPTTPPLASPTSPHLTVGIRILARFCGSTRGITTDKDRETLFLLTLRCTGLLFYWLRISMAAENADFPLKDASRKAQRPTIRPVRYTYVLIS